MNFATPTERIAYLEARVAVLEETLVKRSRELRRLQELLSPHDLLLASRLASGQPPLPDQAYDLSLWQETTEMISADVEEVLNDLWRSLAPVEDPMEDDP